MDTNSNIVAASKYTKVSGVRCQVSGAKRPTSNIQLRTSKAPQLFIPTVTGARARVKLGEWYWKEIKEGGFLCEYLAAEKRKTPRMIRRIAQVMDGFQQNNKSDFQRLAAIPARLYHRWKAEDEHFFDDNDNLRSLKRDNPDLPVYVGPKRVKGTRTRYGTSVGGRVTGSPESTVHSPQSTVAEGHA